MFITLGVFLILLLLFAALGYALAAYSVHIRRQTPEQARAWQARHYDISWYDTLEKEDFTVTSFDGYRLYAQLLLHPAGGNRCVVISHGYTDNRFGSLKYARMYLDLGFHVVIYDLRGHGVNEPALCTYSVLESRDLDAVIRAARERCPQADFWGIHGESLGAATSVAVLKYHPPVDFVVADCGFSEITDVMRAGLRRMHLPGALVRWASLFVRLRCGFRYRDMRPIDSLAGSRVPILFLHGEEDDFIIPEHSRRMQRAAQGMSEIHLIPGAGHAVSILTDPEAYRRHVEDFLAKIPRKE